MPSSRPPALFRRPQLPVPAASCIALMAPLAAAMLPLAAGIALTLCAAPAGAQDMPRMGHMPGAHHGPAERPTVTVTGSGVTMVAPDVATVSVGVTVQAPNAAQAMSDNAAKQRAVIDAAKAQGFAPEDLQTQGLSLSPLTDYSREGQPPVITGYQAQNIVSVRVRDLTKLGALLDAMIAAGATDVQGIVFDRQDSSEASDAARSDAVTDARRRAEVMARAAGMQLGPLLSLSEGVTQSGPMPMMAMAPESKRDSTPVEAGQLALSAQVNAVWALRPAGGPAGAPAGGPGAPGHGPMHDAMHGGMHGGPDQPAADAAPATDAGAPAPMPPAPAAGPADAPAQPGQAGNAAAPAANN